MWLKILVLHKSSKFIAILSKYEFLSQSSAFLIFSHSPSAFEKGFFITRLEIFSFIHRTKERGNYEKKNMIQFIKFRNGISFAERLMKTTFLSSSRACILNIFSSTLWTTPWRCQKNVINYIHLLCQAIWKSNWIWNLLIRVRVRLPMRCRHFFAILYCT